MSRTFRTTDRAERLEALRIRALERNHRRQRRWVKTWDQPVNPWSGRLTPKQRAAAERAERLVHQSAHAYVVIAHEAYIAQHGEAA